MLPGHKIQTNKTNLINLTGMTGSVTLENEKLEDFMGYYLGGRGTPPDKSLNLRHSVVHLGHICDKFLHSFIWQISTLFSATKNLWDLNITILMVLYRKRWWLEIKHVTSHGETIMPASHCPEVDSWCQTNNIQNVYLLLHRLALEIISRTRVD